MDITCVGVSYLTFVYAIKEVRTIESQIATGIKTIIYFLLSLKTYHCSNSMSRETAVIVQSELRQALGVVVVLLSKLRWRTTRVYLLDI